MPRDGRLSKLGGRVAQPCSVVRTRDRVAGARYACSARPDLHTVCRSFPKISSALSAKVCGGSRSAKRPFRWRETGRAQKPDHLEIAARLALQPPARLHPVEIAVDLELQQCRGMIGGPARYFRRHAFEPEFGQIERIDVRVQRANRIALIDPIIEAFGQQSRLSAIRPNHETLHPILPQIARESYRENRIQRCVFTQPGS